MSNYQALMKALEPETLKQMIRDADAENEAVNGICCDEDVCKEDREPPVLVGMFEPIPRPADPYGCENPVNQEDAE